MRTGANADPTASGNPSHPTYTNNTNDYTRDEEAEEEEVPQVETGVIMSVAASQGRLGIAIYDSIAGEIQALQVSGSGAGSRGL